MKILVYFEIRDGQVKKASLEAASAAKKIAGAEVCAVMVGGGVSGLAAAAGKVGVSKVYCVEGAAYEKISNSLYAGALASAASELGCDGIIFSATAMGKDLAPMTAAFFDAGYIADATAISPEAGSLEFVKPVYSGKAFARLAPAQGSRFVASLRPNVFPVVEAPVEAAAEKLSFSPDGAAKSSVVEGVEKGAGELLDVSEADIIVSGGRGMKGPENFPMLAELAKLLGGAMGASRAAVDAGWVAHAHQVGQTGKVVSPGLYIACGISGAIQHLAGMSSSKVIVAINKDKEAPIFNVATYGVVGDLFEIVPLLKEEIKALKAQG